MSFINKSQLINHIPYSNRPVSVTNNYNSHSSVSSSNIRNSLLVTSRSEKTIPDEQHTYSDDSIEDSPLRPGN